MDVKKDRFDFTGTFGVDAFIPGSDGLLYRYFSAERALQTVQSGSLHFSVPDSLNDPFELDVKRISFDLNPANLKKLAERFYPNNPSARQQIIDSAIGAVEKVPAALEELLSRFRESLGICCFTTNPRQKLMWSHYGQSDTGICIGFNFPWYWFLAPRFFVMKVKYEKERSILDHFNWVPSTIPLWAFTKNSDWEYESEVRILSFAFKGLVKYPFASISEIHYGNRIDEKDIGRMESLITYTGNSDYKRFKIGLSNKSYDLISTSF